MTASSVRMSAIIAATLSVAGFTPITASPLPYRRPSTMLAAIPPRSSVGWLGWSRVDAAASQPEGVAEPGQHPALLRHQDQVLIAHDLETRRPPSRA
jgi:hypothetical protein